MLTPTLDAIRQVMASGRYEETLRTIRIVSTITAIDSRWRDPFAIWLDRSVQSRRTESLALASGPHHPVS